MAPAASRISLPKLFALGALAQLMAAVLPAGASTQEDLRPGGQEPEAAPVTDDACEASGEGDCALSLRQLRGQKLLGQLDLEVDDSENASVVEGAAAGQGARPSRYSAEERANMPMGGPPRIATEYNGRAWPTLTYRGTQPMHVFAIGDWGGMDGSFAPEDRPRLEMYRGGREPGPHTFPRSRPACDQKAFIQCFNGGGMCSPSCGFNAMVDTKAQVLVAQQFNQRGSFANPSYVLNVGDNFYYAGIAQKCGQPMDNVSWVARKQFEDIFEKVYTGPGVENAVWFSVLGNHDYGGRSFNWGWDAQIAYTWQSKRWIMPAPYWSVHVDYPDQQFSVDYWMMDSNQMDAQMSPDEDADHNICSHYNDKGATCASAGGPPNLEGCAKWFWDMWAKQQVWVEAGLQASTSDWQIIVTHFPCGFKAGWFTKLYKELGLDLLVTGHRHQQELWPNSYQLGGLTCFVTGGGGGITSEMSPNYFPHQYGFFDLTLTKDTILVESINYDGKVNAKTVVNKRLKANEGKAVEVPVPAPAPTTADGTGGEDTETDGADWASRSASCAVYGCGTYEKGRACQCNAMCKLYDSCCQDFMAKCLR